MLEYKVAIQNKTTQAKEQLFLGVDGGGTKCRAVIYSASRGWLGEGIGGPANAAVDIQQTQDSILQATYQALTNAELEQSQIGDLIAGIALAGVNIPSVQSAMEAWQHPFSQMFITHDLKAACIGAHKGSDGAVIIVGTGSCGYAVVGNEELELGGHGFPHGDKGSGSWIGLEAVKHSLEAVDGIAASSEMSQAVWGRFQDTSDMITRLNGAKPREFASFADIVFQAAANGDENASAILKEGAHYLSVLVRKLYCLRPPRISVVGGLAHRMVPWMDEDVKFMLEEPLESPQQGAVYFAIKKVGGQIFNGHKLISA